MPAGATSRGTDSAKNAAVKHNRQEARARDLVTDAPFNYENAREIPSFAPQGIAAPGGPGVKPQRLRVPQTMRETTSINDIRTAIRELSVRAELAHNEGRHQDAAEIERRIDGYRAELSHRP
jgi:hypothetical protein